MIKKMLEVFTDDEIQTMRRNARRVLYARTKQTRFHKGDFVKPMAYLNQIRENYTQKIVNRLLPPEDLRVKVLRWSWDRGRGRRDNKSTFAEFIHELSKP